MASRKRLTGALRHVDAEPDAFDDAPAATLTAPTSREPRALSVRCGRRRRLRVGIVVPYSWSYFGGVVEHSEGQAESLRALGLEIIRFMGSDSGNRLSAVLHREDKREGTPPPDVRAVGGSVIVPANASQPNIVLSPLAVRRMKHALEQANVDVLHLHEPLTPIICTAALAWGEAPLVATFHASGMLRWLRPAKWEWGYLTDRIEHRFAVSDTARKSADYWFPGDYEILPNGTVLPPDPCASGRSRCFIFVGRNEQRKGLRVLLSAWQEVHVATGHELHIVSKDVVSIRALVRKSRVDAGSVRVLGSLSQTQLTRAISNSKALIAPSLGGESFGMNLTRAFGCATPVIASDIAGYRDVMTPDVGLLVEKDDPSALAGAMIALVSDESRRQERGRAARLLAEQNYSWSRIANRMLEVYEAIAR
jgi:phosphatidylinositol alpha-mannosyltransferase